MKTASLILLAALLAVTPLFALSAVKAAEVIELNPTENHHVAELNSNLPYVAGYHVNTPDLYIYEGVEATAITVSFPSTDPRYFPSGSWLGGGMFVQAQDTKYRNVDYGFYTMLVLDASDDFYLDIGFHQTRESTAPLHMPTSDLKYAYTWKISGIDPETPITLLARWDTQGSVHYSLSTTENNITFFSINISAIPNCENIIKQFYAGTCLAGAAFPLGHYAQFFQFGVVSSQIIADNHWTADLKNPMIFRKPQWGLGTGWHLIDTAWSTQGDINYLDWDWKWGGKPYNGVSARYLQNPLENPYEVAFFYNRQTLPPGTILWQQETARSSGVMANQSVSVDKVLRDQAGPLSIEIAVATLIAIRKTHLRKHENESCDNHLREPAMAFKPNHHPSME